MGWKIKALGKRHNSFKVSEYKMPKQSENSLNARKDACELLFLFLWDGVIFFYGILPKRKVGGR